jgi:pyruvate kinase
MMDRIIRSTERHTHYRSIINASALDAETTPPHAVAEAAATVAETIGAAAIIGFTSSGTTATRIARRRPALPIVAITPNLQVARQMALLWGAHSVQSKDVASYEEMVSVASSIVAAEGLAAAASTLVVVAGIPFGQAGSTNNLRVVTLG